jgi:hypothetical protein
MLQSYIYVSNFFCKYLRSFNSKYTLYCESVVRFLSIEIRTAVELLIAPNLKEIRETKSLYDNHSPQIDLIE